MKMFDMENFHKILNYVFYKIPAQFTRKFDAVICFVLYRLSKPT